MVRFQFLDMLENWLLPQLNTSYDDYILQLDSAPPIFTGMYECFSLVFFSSAGSNMLQKETTKFSLGHPVRRIKHHVISFFGVFVKNSFYVPPLPMSLKELCDRITHALQTITEVGMRAEE